MRWIGLVVVLVLGFVLTPLTGQAQQKGKVPRIGVIFLGTEPSPPPSPNSALVQFRERLGELGYIEGQDIEIEYRFAGDGKGLAEVIEDVTNVRVAVIGESE